MSDVWDNLIATGKIPPMVVVMVHNLPGRRVFDLVANKTFGDFMAKELVPWARAHYNVVRDPAKTVIGGSSAGGFGAAYLGLVHPEVFGNVLSMSGAFWWSPEHNGGICAGVCADPDGKPAVVNQDATTEPNWIAQLALKQPATRVKFYLAAGNFRVRQVWHRRTNPRGDEAPPGHSARQETRGVLPPVRRRPRRRELAWRHDGWTSTPSGRRDALTFDAMMQMQ